MENDYENDIWESFLRIAVIKNSIDEIDDYPFEEIKKIQLPQHYDTKMRRLAKRLHYQEMTKHALKYGKKIVAVAILIVGIIFSFLLQFDEVRAACQNVIISVYEKYIQFSYSNLDTECSPVNLNYIPDGFSLTEETSTELKYYVEYSNEQGDIISLQATAKKHLLHMDNEHYIIREVQINDITGQYFESTDSRFKNYLCWSTIDNHYVLKSSLTEDDLIKIAKNIK